MFCTSIHLSYTNVVLMGIYYLQLWMWLVKLYIMELDSSQWEKLVSSRTITAVLSVIQWEKLVSSRTSTAVLSVSQWEKLVSSRTSKAVLSVSQWEKLVSFRTNTSVLLVSQWEKLVSSRTNTAVLSVVICPLSWICINIFIIFFSYLDKFPSHICI